MAPRKRRKVLTSTVKQSCDFENTSQTKFQDFFEEYSDISEEYLNSVLDASRNANKKSSICTFIIKAELGLAAVDVRGLSDICLAPCFSSEVRVLVSDINTVCEEKEPNLPKKHEKMKQPQAYRDVQVLQHPADVTALSYTNGNLLLSCSLDGTIKAWDRNYRLVQSFTDSKKFASDVQASSKLDHFAVSSLSGGNGLYGASLFSFSRKDPVACLTGHTSPTQCVRFHANGMYVATASRDGTVMMWSTHASGRPVRTFGCKGPEEAESAHRKAIAFSPDGKYLASTYRGSARIWDIASGRLVQTLGSSDQDGFFGDVCFNDSGSQLATGGGADGQLRIWNVNSAESFEAEPSESHLLGRPILRIRCTHDIYTCLCC